MGYVQAPYIDHYPNVPVGSRGRTISGPMMAIQGVVVERQDEKARMVLHVTILGQGAVVEVDSDLLEPIQLKVKAKR